VYAVTCFTIFLLSPFHNTWECCLLWQAKEICWITSSSSFLADADADADL